MLYIENAFSSSVLGPGAITNGSISVEGIKKIHNRSLILLLLEIYTKFTH